MIKKIFKGVSFLYVKLPFKGLLSNMGYKQLKNNFEANKVQMKQLTNPICPNCFSNVVLYETAPLTSGQAKSKKLDPKSSVQVELSCANIHCDYSSTFIAPNTKSAIKNAMEDQITKAGANRRNELIGELTPQFINKKIDDHYRMAQTYKWISILCICASLIAFGFYGILAFLVWLIFGIGIFLLALKSGFRCWQAQTLNVYLPKNLFGFWFKNIAWFQKPKHVHIKYGAQ